MRPSGNATLSLYSCRCVGQTCLEFPWNSADIMQTSSGFFDASKSYLRITQTLDATCGVNASQCRQTMDSFARELQMASACKQDLDNDMPLVIQALNGLVAYPVAYSASCLRDTEGSYCFANAVSNTSSPTDSYSYYLPVGQELPAGSRPTCNSVSRPPLWDDIVTNRFSVSKMRWLFLHSTPTTLRNLSPGPMLPLLSN
jgi:hypothetical protein